MSRLESSVQDLFERQCLQMKQFFDSDDGARTLMDMYCYSRGPLVREPFGVLVPSERQFIYGDYDAVVYNGIRSIVTQNRAGILEVMRDLYQDLPKLKARGEIGMYLFVDIVLAKLIHYYNKLQRGESPVTEEENRAMALDALQLTLLHSDIPEVTGEEIGVHGHPNLPVTIKDPHGEEVEFPANLKGYSAGDRTSSQTVPLGLVDIDNLTGTDSQQVCIFDLYHRVADQERLLRHYEIILGPSTSATFKFDGTQRKIRLPQNNGFRSHTLQLLGIVEGS